MCIFSKSIKLDRAYKVEDVEFKLGHPWGTSHPKHPEVFWESNHEARIKAPFISFDKHVEGRRKTSVHYSVEKYNNCYVEMECFLPQGKNLHYAPLWGLSEPDSGVFEFDVAEYYTDEKGRGKVYSDMHYGENYEEGGKSLKAKRHRLDKCSNRFGVYLKHDRVEYYVNRRLVRTIKDKDVDDKIGYHCNIIISSNIKKQKNILDPSSEMIVRECKVYYI